MQPTSPDIHESNTEILEAFDTRGPDLRFYRFDNRLGASVLTLHYPDMKVYELGVLEWDGDRTALITDLHVADEFSHQGYSIHDGDFVHLMKEEDVQLVLHRIRALSALAEA